MPYFQKIFFPYNERKIYFMRSFNMALSNLAAWGSKSSSCGGEKTSACGGTKKTSCGGEKPSACGSKK